MMSSQTSVGTRRDGGADIDGDNRRILELRCELRSGGTCAAFDDRAFEMSTESKDCETQQCVYIQGPSSSLEDTDKRLVRCADVEASTS